ncbi:S-layer homology domain-containing protein [Ancylothrix sp. C2]|uniref:S-layer homology domain-containing protein n=1 Tax=Ancylothrix sp. D3o TaxID=2953691 RepID=UPI0021BAEB77|nr:S-layer homology domain-containing protein [Ancylothrix sp. D3o]MCT7949931.1 S-layer homology domain-containing protein [Ancylothrix sp. D3o]
MVWVSKWQSKISLPAISTIVFSGLIPWLITPAVNAQSRFKDIQGHWAQSCIEQLASRNIIGGYQDGTFRPSEPMMRVEYAVLLDKAFPNMPALREEVRFIDLPTDYWATPAITRVYRANFLSGASESVFNPTQKVQRLQVLLALVSGLRYSASAGSAEKVKSAFNDAADIPNNALPAIAAATEQRIVVNYPDISLLNPNKEATRAEVAAMVCQALAKGQVAVVPPQYIAQLTPVSAPTAMRKTQVVEAGKIRAEFSFQAEESAEIGKDLRLKIMRGGVSVLDEPVLLSTRKLIQGSESANRVAEGRFLNLAVRDIDADGEAEVIVDLLSVNRNEPCCAYTYIYRFEPAENKYSRLEQFWANVGYEVRDVEGDGVIEFESLDSRLVEVLDLSPADARFPKRIWQYRQGKMVDVTRRYPQLVYDHAKQMWQEFQARRAQKQEVRGVLAAYLGNKYLLGEEEEGWALVEKIYQENDAQDYFQSLRKFYDDLGYNSASN